MAGAIITPSWMRPDASGEVYPDTLLNSSNYEEGMGVATGLGANRTIFAGFSIGSVVPSGTLKLRVNAYANATTGNIVFDTQWSRVPVGSSTFGATRNAEGNTTMTFATTAYILTQALVPLDAASLSAGDEVRVNMVLIAASCTLAVPCLIQPALVWV